MDEQPQTVRRISWAEVLPWLLIVRALGLAIGLPVLFLATAGLLLTPLGWMVGELLFITEGETTNPHFVETVVERYSSYPMAHDGAPLTEESNYVVPTAIGGLWDAAWLQASLTVERLILPARHIFSAELTFSEAAYLALGGFWTLLVWSFFGGAITRMIVVRLARDEHITMREAIRHAMRNLVTYFVSPLFPTVGIVFIGLGLMLLGLLMRLDFGIFLGGLLWIFALLGGLLGSLLLLGLVLGWPLMWVTTSAEENADAFDALSRSYAYTMQRPFHFAFYVIVGLLLGAIGWTFVYYFSEGVLHFVAVNVATGTGLDRWQEVIMPAAYGEAPAEGALVWSGGRLLFLAQCLVRALALGFVYAYFWSAACAIYLLLRRLVDHTEFADVYLEDEEERYGLPPIKAAPEVATEGGVIDADRQDRAADPTNPAEQGESSAQDADDAPPQSDEAK